jgi:hypothetical protein
VGELEVDQESEGDAVNDSYQQQCIKKGKPDPPSAQGIEEDDEEQPDQH